jgi:hypothetical protein
MSIYRIPTTSQHSNYPQRTTIDGVDYELLFMWNGRESKWYVSIFDANGNALAVGRAVVANQPLFERDTSPDLPQGMLFAMDSSYEGSHPSLFELGDRVKIVYVDEDSLA